MTMIVWRGIKDNPWLGSAKLQLEALADHAGKEAAQRMLLPARGFHHRSDRCRKRPVLAAIDSNVNQTQQFIVRMPGRDEKISMSGSGSKVI